MTTGGNQPYFLPYIGYFQLIKAVDKFTMADNMNFIKAGWINRNRILLEGKDFLFSLPLIGASSNKLISDIYIAEDTSKVLRITDLAYKKAPFYNDVFPLVESIFSYEDRNLAKFVGNSIKQIIRYLGINTEIVYLSEIEGLDNSLKAIDRILNICKVLGATNLFNAIGGMELYDKDIFDQHNIKLNFVKTNTIEYKQFNNGFVPNLSILDVLMFNSVEDTNKLLNQYELL